MRFLLLFLTLSCNAQLFHDAAFMAASAPKATAAPPASFTPLTSPSGEGSNIISWWRADTVQTNGGTTFQLTDLAGVHNWHLTNAAAGSTWPVRTGSNTLLFDGIGNYLRCANYTNAQPHEVVLVAWLWKSNAICYYLSSASSDYLQRIYCSNPDFCFSAGTLVNMASSGAPARWDAYSVLFNGASSMAFTNTVLSKAGSAGANVISGLTLGASALNPPGQFGSLYFAELITYSATNSPTSRSNIYYYLKNYSTVCKNLPLP